MIMHQTFQLLIKYQDEMEICGEENETAYINEDEIHPIDWLKKKLAMEGK